MRLALVQSAAGLPPLEDQLTRLQPLAPDEYHIEQTPTQHAAHRLVERLDALVAGDELCLASLGALRMELGDASRLIAELLGRGVRCMTFGPDGDLLKIGFHPADRALLDALCDLAPQRRPDDKARRAAGAPAPELLTGDEIQDIRRLYRAGLTPRRIGLIYRRSPKCISQVLWGRGAPAEAAAGVHA